MSAGKPRVILHIGQHKTGSKALQSFLAKHARGLEKRGILYPVKDAARQEIRAYAISHYRFFALLRSEAMEACGQTESAARFRAEQRAVCRPHESLRDMLDSAPLRRSRRKGETLVLSAEDLFDMHSAHEMDFSMAIVEAGAGILARVFEEYGYDPTVVVYLRRQDHLLGAHYVQSIKGSATNSIEFADFAKTFAPRLRTREILAHWASAFGADRIKVRAYEPATMPGGIVADFFTHALRIPVPSTWTPPPPDVESMNVTPSRDFVEFIRILNRRTAQGLPVPHREDVLDAALVAQSSGAGIGAWLSPPERRALLEIHAEDNASIAAQYRGEEHPLFLEPPPSGDADWCEYPGLSAERAIAIAVQIQEIAARDRR